MKKIILLCAIYFLGCAAYAQVTIGSGIQPEKGALLDLKQNAPDADNTTATLGMVLPRVNITNLTPTVATGANSLPASIGSPASESWDLDDHTGLTVYNLANDCRTFCPGVYTWNGAAWERMGEACPVCIEPCVDCDESANITTFVNVMYDFQFQELETYGVADSAWHQWQVSADNFASDITPLSGNGATTAKYTIPADFIHNYAVTDLQDDKLYFRCLMDDSSGVRVKSRVFEMLFIRTTVGGQGTAFLSGYDEENGVKYLTIQKGENGDVKGGTIKIALLNLGQGENGDAADLGDFYQWGRVDDGHERIAWIKDGNHVNAFDDSNTSDTVSYATNTMPSYDADHQVSSGTAHFGKFITTGSAVANGNYDWYYDGGHDNSLWGNGGLSRTTRDSDITLSGWVNSQNSPCPPGWYVPSSWNFWDTYKGDGTDTSMSNSSYDGTDNIWSWRGGTNNAGGGAIITNDNGGKVFLPASGMRNLSNGSLQYGTAASTYIGGYWASIYSSDTYALSMSFSSSTMYAGNTNTLKSHGMSIRCVAE